jgi:hypothetical protein
MDGVLNTISTTESLLLIMLQDSMVQPLLRCLWAIDRWIRSFVQENLFNAVPPIQECMPKNALEDLTSCLHYSDDWECDDNWDDVYEDPKVVANVSMASHRLKHGILEDGYNRVCIVVCLLLL